MNEFFTQISIDTDDLKLINSKEITQNIIEATVLMSKDRKESIDKLQSGMFKRILESNWNMKS